jgi:hypothetical protein
VGSTLSVFNQAAAPLVAGPARLFVLAGMDASEPQASEQLAAVLEHIPEIKAWPSFVGSLQSACNTYVACRMHQFSSRAVGQVPPKLPSAAFDGTGLLTLINLMRRETTETLVQGESLH